jgi:hypothetical protein
VADIEAPDIEATIAKLDAVIGEAMEQIARLRTDVLDCRVELRDAARKLDAVRTQVEHHDHELRHHRVAQSVRGSMR